MEGSGADTGWSFGAGGEPPPLLRLVKGIVRARAIWTRFAVTGVVRMRIAMTNCVHEAFAVTCCVWWTFALTRCVW